MKRAHSQECTQSDSFVVSDSRSVSTRSGTDDEPEWEPSEPIDLRSEENEGAQC